MKTLRGLSSAAVISRTVKTFQGSDSKTGCILGTGEGNGLDVKLGETEEGLPWGMGKR